MSLHFFNFILNLWKPNVVCVCNHNNFTMTEVTVISPLIILVHDSYSRLFFPEKMEDADLHLILQERCVDERIVFHCFHHSEFTNKMAATVLQNQYCSINAKLV